MEHLVPVGVHPLPVFDNLYNFNHERGFVPLGLMQDFPCFKRFMCTDVNNRMKDLLGLDLYRIILFLNATVCNDSEKVYVSGGTLIMGIDRTKTQRGDVDIYLPGSREREAHEVLTDHDWITTRRTDVYAAPRMIERVISYTKVDIPFKLDVVLTLDSPLAAIEKFDLSCCANAWDGTTFCSLELDLLLNDQTLIKLQNWQSIQLFLKQVDEWKADLEGNNVRILNALKSRMRRTQLPLAEVVRIHKYSQRGYNFLVEMGSFRKRIKLSDRERRLVKSATKFIKKVKSTS